jgi:hypothetical protein
MRQPLNTAIEVGWLPLLSFFFSPLLTTLVFSPVFPPVESKASSSKSFKRRKSPLEHLTIMRSFSARNTGELPIDVFGFTINGLKCQGYGFKVLNCRNFTLTPNSSRKVCDVFTYFLFVLGPVRSWCSEKKIMCLSGNPHLN